MPMKRIALLGATGSIGRQAIEIISGSLRYTGSSMRAVRLRMSAWREKPGCAPRTY